MRTGSVPPRSVKAIENTLMELVGTTVAISQEHSEEAALGIAQMLEKLEVVTRRVQGNRSGMTEITWRDLQLLLSGALRLCLEYLEEQ